MMIKTATAILLAALALPACASKNPKPLERTPVVLPQRPPMKEVQVYSCMDDAVCPWQGALYMDQRNFKNLQENVINTEAYIKMLERLLEQLAEDVE